MSDTPLEVVRRSSEQWLRGDPAFLEALDPKVVWDISAHPLPDVPNRGRGREAFAEEMLATYARGWNDHAELRELVEADDGQVVVVLHETARIRGADVLLDRDLALLWRVVNGRATSFRVFRSKGEAVDAARDPL